MFILYMYDVLAERTHLYHKLLKRYLSHEQASVFMGDLPLSSLLSLQEEIKKTLKSGDNVMEIVSENRHNVAVKVWEVSDGGLSHRRKEDVRHKSNSAFV